MRTTLITRGAGAAVLGICVLAGCTSTPTAASASETARISTNSTSSPRSTSISLTTSNSPSPTATTDTAPPTNSPTPKFAISPASANRGATVSIRIAHCPLQGPDAGQGLFFHDSANLRAPNAPGGMAGPFFIPFTSPSSVVQWAVPSSTSLGAGEFVLLCNNPHEAPPVTLRIY